MMDWACLEGPIHVRLNLYTNHSRQVDHCQSPSGDCPGLGGLQECIPGLKLVTRRVNHQFCTG
jgi:hypothetical protein